MRIELDVGEGERLIPGLRDALESLTRTDMRYLMANPRTPALYCSGAACRVHPVRYQMEPPGAEHWASIPTVLAQGWGDCEDLACWRAAELRLNGHPRAYAFPIELGTAPMVAGGPSVRLIHILVNRDGGCDFSQVEDPSTVLGMPRIPLHVMLKAVRTECEARVGRTWP